MSFNFTRDANKRIIEKTLSFSQTPSIVNNAASLGSTGNTDAASINVLTLSGTVITATGAEINSLSNITPGTASANKLLKLDANKNISGIGALSCDSLTVNGSSITGSGTLPDFLSSITPGTATASKALVLDANKAITGIGAVSCSSLSVNGVTIDTNGGGGSVPSYVTGITEGIAAASKALVLNSSLNISGINSLSTTSLSLGGSSITATASEINFLAGATSGTAGASKALIVNGVRSISNINGFGATNGTFSTLTISNTAFGSQPNILDLTNPGAQSNSGFTVRFMGVDSFGVALKYGSIIHKETGITSGSLSNSFELQMISGGTTASPTYYTPFQILASGGCKMTGKSVGGTSFSINTLLSSDNSSTTAIALENPSSTLVRIIPTLINSTSKQAKLDLCVNSGNADSAIALTLQSDGTRGLLNNINKIAIGNFPSFNSYQLQLDADTAAKPSTTTWTVTSDMRLKEDIEDANLDICYSNIKNLKLKKYKWKDEVYSVEQVKDRHKLGWIAQEVEPIFPNAVDTINANGLEDCKTLNTDQIIASLYGCVQKLMDKVEKLELDNEDKSARIKKLEEFVNSLEISEN